LGTVDLNSFTTTSNWIQTSTSNAAAGSNYPRPEIGFLEVKASSTASTVWQWYTLTGSKGNITYLRNYNGISWSAWMVESSRKYGDNASATASLSATSTVTDVPGASLVVPVLSSADQYSVSAVMDIQSTGVTATTFVGQLSVNDVIQPAQILWNSGGVNGVRGTASQQWLISGLVGGLSYTFKLVGVRSGGADAMVRSNSIHTTLVVTQIV
jgi:hypothetical protein